MRTRSRGGAETKSDDYGITEALNVFEQELTKTEEESEDDIVSLNPKARFTLQSHMFGDHLRGAHKKFDAEKVSKVEANIVSGLTTGIVAPPIDPIAAQRKERKMKDEHETEKAGKGWFEMESFPMTDEAKRDLKLLKMRNYLNPKKHMKSVDSKELPKIFQMGTVVEDAADFYSARLARKQRRQTMAEELFADDHFRRYAKRKFRDIQDKSEAGGKKAYKQKKRQRKPKWKQ